jgi:uncharacterized protein YcaQ
MNITLTKQQARRFALAHQGLWPPHKFEGKHGIVNYIRRVGCIQFDPLDIVGHNSELVLQARVADFAPEMLQDLLYQDRKLVDGSDKVMSIYRVEDWPYFHRQREAERRGLDKRSQITAILPQVRQVIKGHGPLSSIDLDMDHKVDWPWGPTRLARAALEGMQFCGEVVIHHRVHTRKVYDFASRHIPQKLLSASDPNKTDEQYHDWHILRRIGGIGLIWNRAGEAWLGIQGVKSKERSAALQRLTERGEVIEAHVEGIEPPLYMRSADEASLDRALQSNAPSPRAVILAPLDNLLWDRRLVKELFDFSYVWEVYKPVEQRKYGYYVLPILYGDRFIARFEPGRDKKSGALVIKKWWWESGLALSKRMQSDLRDGFKRFLGYLGTDELKIESKTAKRAGIDWLTATTRAIRRKPCKR